jgi:predicted phosphodiesterase
MLRILHLSDIHFTRPRQVAALDLDADLRHEALEELAAIREEVGKFDAVIISGDIAFSAEKEEYEVALQFIDKVCATIGCDMGDVYPVPGNHDISWSILRQNPFVGHFHAAIRDADPEELHGVIDKYMTTEVGRGVAHSPLSNYNSYFAAKYECDIGKNILFWDHEIALNDEVTVALRGGNSTLISSDKDNHLTSKLILGRHQMCIQRGRKKINVFITHHPPEWLLDGDQVMAELGRAHLVLMGHTHEHKITKKDNTVLISAGALHPERGAGEWTPRFNFIELSMSQIDRQKLEVKIYPRVWSAQGRRFVPEDQEPPSNKFFVHHTIAPWEGYSGPLPVISGQSGQQPASRSDTVILPLPPEATYMEPDLKKARRRLVNRYMRLSYESRLAIALEMDLVTDDDRSLDEMEQFRMILARATEGNMLRVLFEKTARFTDMPVNPFPEGT